MFVPVAPSAANVATFGPAARYAKSGAVIAAQQERLGALQICRGLVALDAASIHRAPLPPLAFTRILLS